MNPSLTNLEYLLGNHTRQASDSDLDNDMLVTCLPYVRNIATDHVGLMFSGWRIELYDDGTWKMTDTGGCMTSKRYHDSKKK